MGRDLDRLGDLAALHVFYRITRLADRYTPAQPARPGLIAGLIPRAFGSLNPDDRKALDEREELIESRARELVTRARSLHEPWIQQIPEPQDPDQELTLIVVAAYRDRWQVTGSDPLGPPPDDDTQRLDYERAATQLATFIPDDDTPASRAQTVDRDGPSR